MIFTSFNFFVFLPIVFILYWVFFRYKKIQNIILLLCSYVFYGWWDWRFCFLLFFSSTFAYLMAHLINNTEDKKRRYLILVVSISVHMGILGYFKYTNFFIESFVQLSNSIGVHLNYLPLHIILPIGISFFTFHLLGYTIDIYNRLYKPEKNYLDFLTVISFFPQLTAGPIERGHHIIPQFKNKRIFNWYKIEDGLSQILWGFFKKIIIADTIAIRVNYVYANYHDLSGSTVALGIILFTFQMYCDFSGYSDIAIGTARLFGIELMQNFNYPFFSTSLSELWRKWHISLTTWIMDYIFTPLSFLKRDWAKWGVVYAIILSFGFSGLWHGANWTYVLWGLLNGIGLGYEVLTKKTRKNWSKKFNPIIYSIISGLLVFTFWTVTQMVFKASNIGQIAGLIQKVFSLSLFTIPDISFSKIVWIWVFILLIIEWFQRRKKYGLEIGNLNYMIRWTAYAAIIVFIITSKNLNNQREFLYFHF